MDVKQLIHEFAALQSSLIRALREAHPHVRDWDSVLDLPKRGEIEVDGERWHFRRHGVGAHFTGARTERVVDPHVRLLAPTAVDAWRLCQYCESIGLAELNYAGRTYSALDERAVAECLRALGRDGALAEDPEKKGLWTPTLPRHRLS